MTISLTPEPSKRSARRVSWRDELKLPMATVGPTTPSGAANNTESEVSPSPVPLPEALLDQDHQYQET